VDESRAILRAAQQMADAIARRDGDAIVTLVTADFVHRTPGEESRDLETFLRGIRAIPGDILFVRLTNLQVDVDGRSALLSGVQEARVRVEGQDVDDRRSFVDWYVKPGEHWLLRVAVDLPAPAPAATGAQS
jgi:ketosteroid isomerase-like protein